MKKGRTYNEKFWDLIEKGNAQIEAWGWQE